MQYDEGSLPSIFLETVQHWSVLREMEGRLSLLSGQGPTCLRWRHRQPTNQLPSCSAAGSQAANYLFILISVVHAVAHLLCIGVTRLLRYERPFFMSRVIFTVRDSVSGEGNIYIHIKKLAEQDWRIVQRKRFRGFLRLVCGGVAIPACSGKKRQSKLWPLRYVVWKLVVVTAGMCTNCGICFENNPENGCSFF
jgi:hypothetical protein